MRYLNRLNRFSLNLLLTGALLVLLALFFFVYVWAEKRIDRANDARQLSFILSEELRQSSDDLTRMARTYVATGEPGYLRRYYDILDIRDGRKPRPQGFSRVYWDVLPGDGDAPRPVAGESAPLIELLRQSGCSAPELAKLSEAKVKSDQLALLEKEAMQLAGAGAAGTGAAGTGAAGTPGVQARAAALLYDRNYRLAKAAIMEPIDQFYRLLDERTRDAVSAAEQLALAIRVLFLGCAGCLLVMIWRVYATLHELMGGSVDEVHARIASIGQGNFSTGSRPGGGEARSVMGWLAETQAKLQLSDQERRDAALAEQALAESEKRWKFAIEGSGDGVWDWNIQTDEAKYSPRWKQMLGYEEGDLLPANQEWVDRVHPEDRGYVAAAMRDYLDGRTTIYVVEYRLKCRDDSYKWILGRGMVVSRGEDGRPLRMIGTHTDITGRKQMEEQLRLSEKKFSTAFRVSPDAINLTRLQDGTYLEINEGFSAITGYSAADVVGRSAIELDIWVNPADRDRLVAGLLEHGVVNNLEARFRRKDGSTLTGIMSARVIEVEGEPCLLSISRDISERKRAEEYLRESEKNLRTLMDSMPAGVWWFDDDGNVEYLNGCFVEQFRYTLEDIPTLADWLVLAYPDPEYRNSYLAARNAAIAQACDSGAGAAPREAKITCKDGTQRHVIINTRFALGRTVEIFTDITEREQFLHHYQKVEKLESLGVLAGGIAHDFNNILTAIMGNISFARSLLDPSHKSALLLSKAEQAAGRAADLAHQLLTFAKGGQPVKKAVSVRHLLRESSSFMLHGSNVSIDIDIAEELPAIEVDEGQICQVINNIIINACQAMPEGGTIVVRGQSVRVDAANLMALQPGRYVRLDLTDTGCGISEEDQQRIFDPYFTTKTGGSGLGLASVHSIVTRHGGYIGVQSALGIGTCFELLLPASDRMEAEESCPPAPAAPGTGEGCAVLVMDDEEIIREMTSQMLASLGYQAATCGDGAEAIARYRAALDAGSPFSAVIMDLTIPGGMGGREAARQILALDPKARLVVSSGYSTDPIMAESARFGFCATLTKPYTLAEVAATLGAVLAGEPAA
jgi:two-component system, cell cycle sensor histidine kinase and response regulator CckA